MGTARSRPEPVKLFLAVIATPAKPWEQIVPLLTGRFGAIDFITPPYDFSHTDYYRDEMGAQQFRRYLTFTQSIDREILPDIKAFTNDIESRFSISGKRTINLDPGYLGREKLVLASTKDFFHRIYLRNGIFAEVTLAYRKGRFQYFSWTYPDYREPLLHEFLQKPRAVLVTEIRLLLDNKLP